VSTAITLGSKAGENGLTSSQSDITFYLKRIEGTPTISIGTSGDVKVQGVGGTASFAQAFNSSQFGFNSNSQTMRSLTFGSEANAQNITINTALNATGSVSVFGGTVSLGSNLTTNATSGNGISITGQRITQAAGVSVSTSGANISYTASGGATTSGTDNAIVVGALTGHRSVINAAGGNIALSGAYGTTAEAGGGDSALWIFGADIKTTGVGTISITGDATNTNTTSFAYGLNIGRDSLLQSQTGAITLTGIGGKATGNSRGLVADQNSFKVLSASGAITLRDQQAIRVVGSAPVQLG
jgi:hypothetical protein